MVIVNDGTREISRIVENHNEENLGIVFEDHFQIIDLKVEATQEIVAFEEHVEIQEKRMEGIDTYSVILGILNLETV